MNCRLPIADCRLPAPKSAEWPCRSIENRKLKIADAFTLIELLVVILILGILAALVVPALKNLGKSNISAGATRQLLDAVGRARQLAMADRTTVYMVFVPTNFWGGMTTEEAMSATNNLLDKQLTGYTFVSYGKPGDQPGQHQWKYLAPWNIMPEGTFIAAQKFAGTNSIYDASLNVTYPIAEFNYTNTIPFPTEDNTNISVWLPYIAFNYLGQLTDNGVNLANAPEYIPLAHGAVLPTTDPITKQLIFLPEESPPGNSTNSAYNLVRIDPLTGRATLLYEKVR